MKWQSSGSGNRPPFHILLNPISLQHFYHLIPLITDDNTVCFFFFECSITWRRNSKSNRDNWILKKKFITISFKELFLEFNYLYYFLSYAVMYCCIRKRNILYFLISQPEEKSFCFLPGYGTQHPVQPPSVALMIGQLRLLIFLRSWAWLLLPKHSSDLSPSPIALRICVSGS